MVSLRYLSLVLTTTVAHLSPSSAFVVSSKLVGPQQWRCHCHRPFLLAKSSDDDGDSGMAEAFRQLESLGSLDEESPPKPTKSIPAPSVEELQAEPVAPEKEVQMYKEMVEELQDKDEDDLYSNVLEDMGGSSSTTPKMAPKVKTPPQLRIEEGTSNNQNDRDTEDFMNQALKEALEEVKVNNPSISDSILDDKEIMKEIEAIFERGNDKLFESLEEIRKEQQELAKASATKSAQAAADVMHEDARRLSQAEDSMVKMLQKVKKETEEVDRAVADLKAAEAELDKDFLFRLRSGGIVKQTSLVGLVLFSFRSIVDTIASVSDPSHMIPALIQGGISIVCAAVFFLL